MNFEWRNDIGEQHLREDVCLYNIHTKEVFSDKMAMTFLKIPMMEKDAEECETTLERWIYLLKNMDKMENIPQSFAKEPVFRRLAQKAKYAALTDKERKAYRESLKVYRDNYAIAETERTIGREEGRAEGRAEGLTQGIAEGIEMERRQSIRAMLSFGIPAEKIADTYHITADEVAAIAATPE